MNAKFPCHLEYTMNDLSHIVLDADYTSGRLTRTANQTLCGAKKWNWSRDGAHLAPTCKQCARILSRHSTTPPPPTITQLALMKRIDYATYFNAHWGHGGTKKALFGYGYIELYRSPDGNDCLRLTASGKKYLPAKPAIQFEKQIGESHVRLQVGAIEISIESKPTIITFGYEGRTPADLKKLLEELDATLIDARYKSRSRNPIWAGESLKKALGKRYNHVPEWGNVNYKVKGGPIQLADYQKGKRLMQIALNIRPAVVIMCVCKDPAKCHRTTIASLLRADGYEVSEYASPRLGQPLLF